MSISKKNAFSLAVSYHAYLTAHAADDHSGVITWGGLLLEAQTKTRVELHTPDLVRRCIARARREEADRMARATEAAVDVDAIFRDAEIMS